MKKFKTQIIIVSDQVVPNVTPVIDKAIAPERVIGTLNALAQNAENDYSLKIRCKDINDEACKLLRLFDLHGSITEFDDRNIEFSSKSGRDYCKGFWLEEYIYSKLEDVDKQIGLQDYAYSIEIESEAGIKNEIDAAFLYNNELYIIECKTARMDDKATDVLYKIDTISNYAGLYTKPIIATFKSLTKYDRKRAEDMGIMLVEGQNLNTFSKRIIEYIKR